jgi:hypothetical protein
MSDIAAHATLLRRYRLSMGFFIVGLVLSGVTAFPLLMQMEWLVRVLGVESGWLVVVRDGLRETYAKYPWVGYGTDWLGFAHLAIAVFFIGPYMDPVRNVWVLKAGLVACAGILVLAFIAGPIRGVPVGWRLIDCAFGVIGAVPLLYCLKLTGEMGDEKGGREKV